MQADFAKASLDDIFSEEKLKTLSCSDSRLFFQFHFYE